MLSAIVLAIPDPLEAGQQGDAMLVWILKSRLSERVFQVLSAAIFIAQYLCGLATVTSASRMTYAFARDGGLPCSAALAKVHPVYQVPVTAIWTVSLAALVFTIYSPVYSTITAVCTICLYLSYVLPAAIGFVVYRRSWNQMGPWDLGGWFRPLAAVSVVYCSGLLVIGMQPPNDKAMIVMGAFAVMLAAGWMISARKGFRGPPEAMLRMGQRDVARESGAAEE
jgi:amino acid transporter